MLYPIVLNRINSATGSAVRSVELIAIAVAALVVFMHRENIKRLYKGEESKLDLHKKKKEKDSETDKGKKHD